MHSSRHVITIFRLLAMHRAKNGTRQLNKWWRHWKFPPTSPNPEFWLAVRMCHDVETACTWHLTTVIGGLKVKGCSTNEGMFYNTSFTVRVCVLGTVWPGPKHVGTCVSVQITVCKLGMLNMRSLWSTGTVSVPILDVQLWQFVDLNLDRAFYGCNKWRVSILIIAGYASQSKIVCTFQKCILPAGKNWV